MFSRKPNADDTYGHTRRNARNLKMIAPIANSKKEKPITQRIL